MTMASSTKRKLWLDTETYSSVDLKASGLFKYMESDDFEILLLPFAWDDEPVRVLDMFDPADRELLPSIIEGLKDPDVIKVAHNSAFERSAYRQAFGFYQHPEQWVDTMILCAYNGLPLSLEAAGAALNLPIQKRKDGKLLINYFCKPCKPTKSNGGRTRNLPHHDPEKWERFKLYARDDVETERLIHKRLSRYPVTDFERRIWALDARINERGVKVDMELAESAVAVDEAYSAELLQEMQRLTGLENPNSVAQLKEWLGQRGLYTDSLDKAAVVELLSQAIDPTTKRVLQLRQMLSKTSTKKYSTMLAMACADERVRGLTQYYGATRTGRWAGRGVQLQNLAQNHLEAIGEVRELVRDRDLETLEMIFPNVTDVLSQLIRTALVAKDGHTFLVADFSAIEARVIAYLAGEQWRMDVFAQGGDIYCSSASQMFKVPVVKHGINGHLRQKGKIAELACGYGGGVNALLAFGADKMGLTEPEMQEIVTQWREASPSIPRFWREAEQAAKQALAHPGKVVKMRCGVMYRRDADALKCQLPSGRQLTYWDARLEDGSIVFMGQAGQTGIWAKVETWGGKLVENIVQAYAADCLRVSMDRLEAAGFQICFHVHDEVVAEAPKGTDWREMAEIMGRPIDWAPGLLLRADGYTTDFYMKD